MKYFTWTVIYISYSSKPHVKFPTISTRLSHCSTKILTHQWTDNWLACLHFKTCFTKPLAHVGYTFMNSFCWVTLVFFSFWLINSFKLTVVKYCKFYFFSRKTARGRRDHKFILSNLSIISNEPIINSTTAPIMPVIIVVLLTHPTPGLRVKKFACVHVLTHLSDVKLTPPWRQVNYSLLTYDRLWHK